jgi:TatD DNase family protein
MWIDSHCHLDADSVKHEPGGLLAVLARARDAKVARMVAVGVGEGGQAASEVQAVAEREPDVWFTAGIHPHDAAARSDAEVALVTAAMAHPRCVALGEIGLDFFYENSPREAQAALFRELLAVADAARKPAMLHIRDAHDEALAILRETPRAVPGVVHCFTADWAAAEKYLALGFYLSIPGIVTFKTAAALVEAVQKMPRDRVIVETDSPFLAPVPMRGKKNEPAFVHYTGAKIAELWGVSVEEVAAVTSANAARLFCWA